MSNEKTLVVLIPAFPENEQDMNWLPTQQSLLRWVKKLFPDIHIVVLSFIYPHRDSKYEWEGMNVISFDGMKYRKLRRLFLWRRIWNQLSKINRQSNIVGLLSFWCGECALVGTYFGKLHSIDHHIVVCGQDARRNNRLVKFIRPSAHELVALSDFLADEFYNSHHVRPAHVIPNGIDASMFPFNEQLRDIDIIGVGSLSRLKQYDIFMEIVQEIKKPIPGIKAVLCGDGEDMGRLKIIRRDLLLESTVEMPGMVVPTEAIGMMQCAKIFLHPSSYEGFSAACLEALYAGNHVISFTKPMHHEIQKWHVVKTKEEMLKKTLSLLQAKQLDHNKVFVYSIEDTAKELIHLFSKNRNQ